MSQAQLLLGFVWVLTAVGATTAPAAEWKLVWQDDFEREHLGSAWYVGRGRATIVDGRMKLEGTGATALIDRAFKPDVRLEFDAWADPARPPCDLSAALAASKLGGYGYLLAFGGCSNRVNQIVGPGIHQVDQNPPFLIEHGRRYHCVAQKEGKRLTYTVNGTRILTGTVEEPLGGPGFDRVGLVTWTAILVDNVKVYERSEPAPDTPRYVTALQPLGYRWSDRKLEPIEPPDETIRRAVQAYNDGKIREALERFRSAPNGVLKVVGLAYVYGDLAFEEQPGQFEALAELFGRLASRRPDDAVLADYAWAARQFAELKIGWGHSVPAMRLVMLGPQNNPFYYKARLYQARYTYWSGAEGGDRARIARAIKMMAELKKLWPENPILREYTGPPVPWGQDLVADTASAPAWAAYLREAYARQVRILEWWFEHRQQPDGQLGGGWGDDVELLRTWVPVAAISTAAEKVIRGIERMCEGLWRGVLKNGYAADIGDVEHSAEPSADSLPTMILLRYGDPRYVEWNMASARTIRDVLTGIDRKGYVRFKSTEIGANGVHTDPRAGGDTGYHARAMKHLIWLAWWGNTEARNLFLNWVEGWRAATLAKIDTKLPGVVPGTIWYPSGEIFPPSGRPWWDPDWNYYGFPGLAGMIHDSFLAAYALSGDRRFLEPFQLAMDLVSRGPLLDSSRFPPGSDSWVYAQVVHQVGSDQMAVYRWLTAERVYDEYARRFAGPTQLYQMDHDLAAYLRQFERTAKGLRTNFGLRTREVIATDRAGLGGAKVTWGAYTGAVVTLRDARTPTMAVTWETPDTNFAALVTETTRQRLRVWIYSFRPEPTRMGMRLWRLDPGRYTLREGAQMPGEHAFQHRYGWRPPRTVTVRHKGERVWLDVPPGKVWVVDLRLREPIEISDRAPDLAIARRDLVRRDEGQTAVFELTVHNIGNLDAPGFRVAIQTDRAGRWQPVAQTLVEGLCAPRELQPSTITVRLRARRDELAERCRVVLDPNDAIYELCETNNACEL